MDTIRRYDNMKKIAWIGTGVMGKPMALHLADAGHSVSVFNRTHSKAQALEPKATAFDSIEGCVKDADIVFTIVGYPKDVEMVYDEIFKHAKKDALLIDMTTSSPSLAKSIYDKGQTLGFEVLDAPVTGGDLGAINATLSIMVGGNKESFAFLSCLTASVKIDTPIMTKTTTTNPVIIWCFLFCLISSLFC